MTHLTLGVDVSKDWLDAHRLADRADRRFANSKSGWRALIKWSEGAPIAFEPSGPYHRGLEQALAAAGRPAVKINPLQARRFAQAIGTRAKTDKVDARMLARMAATLDLPPTAALSDTIRQLKELVIARQALVKDRTAAKNRTKQITRPLLIDQAKARLLQIETQMKAIEAEIDTIIKGDPELAARRDILASIPGISSITATLLLVEAPELGSLEAKQAACLAGLAPFTRQSGKWKGKAMIAGGRALLRQALYMPALVAARHNHDLKAVYQRLRNAGKPPKLALTALMRKLVILANALLRDQRLWSPHRP